MCRLCANAVLFHVRDLSICRFGYLRLVCVCPGTNPLQIRRDDSICHNVFIYTSVVEYLGCFHVSAIVNNVAVNMQVQLYL